MRIIIMLILLSASGLATAFSQTTVWNQRSGLLTDSEFSTMICNTIDDKIIFANSFASANIASEGTNIFEFDQYGCQLVNYNIPEPANTESLILNEIITTEDGGFVATGGVYVSAALFVNLVIFKFNNEYEVEWWQHFGVNDTDNGIGIVEVSDGYIAVGYTFGYDSPFMADSYLVKVDKQGNLMQERVISTVPGEMNSHTDIINWSLDTILISGVEKDNIDGNIIDYLSVIKYNKDLVALDSARYLVDELNTGGGRMLKTSDGKLIINCARRYWDLVTDVWIAKVDADIDVIYWEDYIDINLEYDLCEGFAELSNGDLLFVGYTDADEGSGPIIYQAWISKYTQYGQHLWTKLIENEENIQGSIFWDIKVNSNDEIYIAGSRYTFDTFTEYGTNIYNSDPWYIRMDTAGNIYKPLELIHNFIDDTIPVHQPHLFPPYEAINGLPCYDYLWVVQDPDGLAISGPEEDNAFVPTKQGTYEFMLLVIDEEGSQVNATFNLFVTPAIGMDDALPLQHIIVIDHVIHHQCRVEISDKQIDRMVVYDINGRTVAHQAIEGRSEISLNAANWSAGVYHFAAYNQKGELIEVVRAIKE